MSTNRRSFLLTAAFAGPMARLASAQTSSKPLIPHPSWECSMPQGIPSPESGQLVFEAQMKLDRLAKIGKTPYGNRRVAVGLEGKVTGPKLAATIMSGAL